MSERIDGLFLKKCKTCGTIGFTSHEDIDYFCSQGCLNEYEYES